MYIFFNLDDIKIDAFDLYLSLAVSIFNLVYNLYKLRSEAKFHCMSFATYALSVLQLGEIPIVRLIPRLPGISNGEIDSVNYSDFKIDKESLGPIIEALNNPLCKLKTMKLSLGSLKLLDFETCSMLGSFLSKKNVNVVISQIVNTDYILDMFKQLDTNDKGYLNEKQFTLAFEKFRHDAVSKSSVKSENEEKSKNWRSENEHQLKTKLFQDMAVRRIKQRDRVYFGMFCLYMFTYLVHL